MPLFKNLLGKSAPTPTLDVCLETDVVFVCPRNEIMVDPFLKGTVVLTLPTEREVKRVVVLMEGLADAYAGERHPYETTQTLMKELSLDAVGTFAAGEHGLNFSFIVPSSTAVYQRCNYGRVRHYVKATVEFADEAKPLVTPPRGFWITANPSGTGQPPLPLLIAAEHQDGHLGPIGVTFSAPHLTVSSLVHCHLNFVSPPAQVSITSINIYISQSFTIYYSEAQDSQVVQPPPKRYLLSKVNVAASPSPAPNVKTDTPPVPDVPLWELLPLKKLGKEEEWEYRCLARMPEDSLVRPSTLVETESPLRVEHKIVLEVRYETKEDEVDENGKKKKKGRPKERLLVIGKPLTISSCCCLIDSIPLPAYTTTSNDSNPKDPFKNLLNFKDKATCMCNSSLAGLRDKEGLELERADMAGQVKGGDRVWTEMDARREEKTPAQGEGGRRWRSDTIVV